MKIPETTLFDPTSDRASRGAGQALSLADRFRAAAPAGVADEPAVEESEEDPIAGMIRAIMLTEFMELMWNGDEESTGNVALETML